MLTPGMGYGTSCTRTCTHTKDCSEWIQVKLIAVAMTACGAYKYRMYSDCACGPMNLNCGGTMPVSSPIRTCVVPCMPAFGTSSASSTACLKSGCQLAYDMFKVWLPAFGTSSASSTACLKSVWRPMDGHSGLRLVGAELMSTWCCSAVPPSCVLAGLVRRIFGWLRRCHIGGGTPVHDWSRR